MAKLWGEDLTQQNISDAFPKDRLDTQKKTYCYRERDESQRLDLMECLPEKEPHQIVCLDEAGI